MSDGARKVLPLPLREGVGGGGGVRFPQRRSNGPLPPTPSREGRGRMLRYHRSRSERA
jgi:hypothetical protein